MTILFIDMARYLDVRLIISEMQDNNNIYNANERLLSLVYDVQQETSSIISNNNISTSIRMSDTHYTERIEQRKSASPVRSLAVTSGKQSSPDTQRR